MIIESIYIKNFGKLSDVRIDLADGVNILREKTNPAKARYALLSVSYSTGFPAEPRKS